MKKLAVLLITITLIFALCGCDTVTGLIDQAVDTVSPTMPQDKVYENLDRLIGYTDGLKNTDLTGSFTFVCMLFDEGEEIYFEDEDYTGFYYSAGISRNWDDFFLLDTIGLEGSFKNGDIVQVTGETDGTIYWTEDNNRVEVLCVKATAIEAYEPEDIAEKTGSSITLSDGNEIKFLGAHATEDSFGEAIVVYFEFKNNGSAEAAPSLSDFYIEYNGDEASKTIFSLDEVDSNALGMTIGIVDKTYAGKSQIYYLAYTGDAEASDEEPIYFELYDDEFRCTYSCGISIAESLEAMKAE